MKGLTLSPLLLGFASFTLVAYGPSSDSSKAKLESPTDHAYQEKIEAEIKALGNPNRTNADMMERLHTLVKMKDGFLVVKDPLGNHTWIFASNTPWEIECGLGASVFFGFPNSGDPVASVGSSGAVNLASIPLPQDRCEELGPMIGREIRSMMDGR